MKSKIFPLLLLMVTAGIFCANSGNRFEIGEKRFLLDSKPYTIKAAELHYPRIPMEYWDHRIKMSKALGMNTVCVYVFWNYHEEKEGEYNFSGNRDIRKFIEMCGKEGMNVIVRPGPYVCAEWEMGGLPWWLLKDKDVRLRENDEHFLSSVARFQERLAEELKGLTADEGGPIIMIQVENEYGSYGIDKEYVGKIRDILKSHYPETVMFQCDWSSNFMQNGLDDLLWTLNFGTWADPVKEFQELKELRPDSPLMCSEYWSGWFDKWGANHETRDADDMIEGIRKMLDNDISFSLYMTHGGTDFGHWAGANSPGYAPDVTSYDYDAPIDERGNTTPKYFALRELMQEYSDEPLPEIPAAIEIGTFPEVVFEEVAPIYSNLKDSVLSQKILNMEALNQGYGSVVYKTTVSKSESPQELVVTAPHDYAMVFVDGEYIGKLDRRFDERTLTIPPYGEGSELTIFVEATGRINFGRGIKDFKGITERVTVDGDELSGWEIFCLPDNYEFYSGLNFEAPENRDIKSSLWKQTAEQYAPGVYKVHFDVREPKDTWLDLSTWGKGVVYLNGKPLGRFWSVGPQQTLFAPGCWFEEGDNELLIFDVMGPEKPVVSGLKNPINDFVRDEMPNDTGYGELQFAIDERELLVETEVVEGEWIAENFDSVVSRYVMLESDDKDLSLGEIKLAGENGEELSSSDWEIMFVSSEEKKGNHTTDKAIDIQETTYWKPAEGCEKEIVMIIDLGTPRKISGMSLLGGKGKKRWNVKISIPLSL